MIRHASSVHPHGDCKKLHQKPEQERLELARTSFETRLKLAVPAEMRSESRDGLSGSSTDRTLGNRFHILYTRTPIWAVKFVRMKVTLPKCY